MTKQLYEEALADVKKLKEVAEDNAKRAILDAVTPRIRDLIENQLLGEDNSDPVDEDKTGEPPPGKEVLHDEAPEDDSKKVSGVDDKVDEQELDEGDYVLNTESIKALGNLKTSSSNFNQINERLTKLGKKIERLKNYESLLRETTAYFDVVSKTISEVENTYSQVQSDVDDLSMKSRQENVLEGYYSTLKRLMERKMNRKNLSEKKLSFEIEVPDELELDEDALEGIQLTVAEESGDEDSGDSEGDEELDLDLDSEEEEGEEEDTSSDEEEEEEEEESDEELEEEGYQAESRRLSDDLVVEIDEGMLRREISRMKMLREESSKPPQIKGLKAHGPGKVADGFEDDDLGDPFVDIDLRESDGGDEGKDMDPNKKTGDSDLDEADTYEEMDSGMEEADDVNQYGGRGGRDLEQLNHQSRQPGHTVESIRRRLAAESRLQMEAKRKAKVAKKKAIQAEQQKQKAKTQKGKQAASGQKTKMGEAYAFYARRFNESVVRSRRLQVMLSEADNRGRTLNGAPARSAAETNNLRNKLAETNLFNAKLLFTNKLLQNESLTKRQKAEIIERLDEARSEREVKLVYESLVKTLQSSTARPMMESTQRGVIGSSSRPVSSAGASNSLNEGFEAERWAKLAGIAK